MTLWNLRKSRTRRRRRKSASASGRRRNKQSRPPSSTGSDRRSLDGPSFPGSRSRRRPTTTGFTLPAPCSLQKSSLATQRHSSRARGSRLSREVVTRIFAEPAGNKAVLACLVISAVLRFMLSVLAKLATHWGSTLHQSRAHGEINTASSILAAKAERWPRSCGAKTIRPRHPSIGCKTWLMNPE